MEFNYHYESFFLPFICLHFCLLLMLYFCFFVFHFRVFNTGGSRGRAGRTPPIGPNSFVFAYIFTKKRPHQRSTPPPPPWVHAPYGKSWIRHCLTVTTLLFYNFTSICIHHRQDLPKSGLAFKDDRNLQTPS